MIPLKDPNPKRVFPLLPTKQIDDIPEFNDNSVYTTKYSPLNFIFIFLYEQFSQFCNLFFLFITFLQLMFHKQCQTDKYDSLKPLSIILGFTALKELWEDYRRKMADDLSNESLCWIWDPLNRKFRKLLKKNIRVGDVVRVEKEKDFPTDLLLLVSNREDSSCYVDTCNIDGETNLKGKKCIFDIDGIVDKEERCAEACDRIIDSWIKCDEPNKNIYEFNGYISLSEGRKIPLKPENLLLRSSSLKNTSWIVGVSVYTGVDTKIIRNTESAPIKVSVVQRMSNVQMVYLFCLLISFCLIAVIGNTFTKIVDNTSGGSFWERACIIFDQITMKDVGLKMITYIVLLNNMFPISLIVSMEGIRIALSKNIENDMDIYDENSKTGTLVKTTSLVEEIGQVKYIFSDKTGTLTRNEMVLKQLCTPSGLLIPANTSVTASLAGSSDGGHSGGGEEKKMLLFCMATCHTAFVDEDRKGSFQSNSPDEVAILEGASGFGQTLTDRSHRRMTVNGKEEYEIMDIIEFSSRRKRMTIILRPLSNDADADAGGAANNLLVITKGADSIMKERLNANCFEENTAAALFDRIDELAVEGLRTLVFGWKEIEESVFVDWKKRLTDMEIQSSSNVDPITDEMESNLTLAGATGVEDRLQEDVPLTLRTLHEAGIHLWVLTGDKLETAINIGYSSELLAQDTKILSLTTEDPAAILRDLDDFTTKPSASHNKNTTNTAIVVQASSLQHILDSRSLKDTFVEKAKYCRSIICCRVSPAQKAKVVEMVKSRVGGAVTLAIGDGANDVGMIQAASVGVGISGKEGLQAARSADFSIGQFKFLQKLLLVHGAWAYYRIAKASIFVIYRNILVISCLFWYSFYNKFTGWNPFEYWMLACFNFVFTLPVQTALAITDKYVNADSLMKYPVLYHLGHENSFYNPSILFRTTLNALSQSFIASAIGYITMRKGFVFFDSKGNGCNATGYIMGTTLFVGILFTVGLKAHLLANTRSLILLLGTIFTPLSVLIYIYVTDIFSTSTLYNEFRGVSLSLLSSVNFWGTAILIPFCCLFFDYIWKFYQRNFTPKRYHVVQNIVQNERKMVKRSMAPSKKCGSDGRRRRKFKSFAIFGEEVHLYSKF